MRINLPHGETDPRKTYSMPDPDALKPARDRVRHACYPQPAFSAPDEITVSRSDLVRLLTLADGYIVLTTDVMGQGCMVGKLRDIWRARRARRPQRICASATSSRYVHPAEEAAREALERRGKE